MINKNHINHDIMDFIIQEVEAYPQSIATVTATHFGISRMTANRYLQKLIADGYLKATGVTKARKYQLYDFLGKSFSINITNKTEEDVVWRENLLPWLKNLPQNVIDICQFGVTEMVNNVIDHSGSKICTIQLKRNAKRVAILIEDEGVGIFEKIRATYQLSDPRHALLELSKGKLTTDPGKHSGEGVFFTSRMFDKFTLLSDQLYYSREMQNGEDWLVEEKDQQRSIQGTRINLIINVNAAHTAKEIFDKYTDDDYRFARTHVPVRLARYANEQLVSRSQAKRVLTRFDKFSEVSLDFQDVEQIGQAFADEIFRVYKNAHPNTLILVLNASEQILQMIKHVQAK